MARRRKTPGFATTDYEYPQAPDYVIAELRYDSRVAVSGRGRLGAPAGAEPAVRTLHETLGAFDVKRVAPHFDLPERALATRATGLRARARPTADYAQSGFVQIVPQATRRTRREIAARLARAKPVWQAYVAPRPVPAAARDGRQRHEPELRARRRATCTRRRTASAPWRYGPIAGGKGRGVRVCDIEGNWKLPPGSAARHPAPRRHGDRRTSAGATTAPRSWARSCRSPASAGRSASRTRPRPPTTRQSSAGCSTLPPRSWARPRSLKRGRRDPDRAAGHRAEQQVRRDAVLGRRLLGDPGARPRRASPWSRRLATATRTSTCRCSGAPACRRTPARSSSAPASRRPTSSTSTASAPARLHLDRRAALAHLVLQLRSDRQRAGLGLARHDAAATATRRAGRRRTAGTRIASRARRAPRRSSPARSRCCRAREGAKNGAPLTPARVRAHPDVTGTPQEAGPGVPLSQRIGPLPNLAKAVKLV